MAIKANWKVNNGTQIFNPGDVITGISLSDEKRLVKSGAAQWIHVISDSTFDSNQMVSDEQIKALSLLLNPMNKKELLAYADQVGIKDVNEKMKNDDIHEKILEDARQNGIDLNSLSDGQLIRFAEACGVKGIADEMDREQVMDVIEAHFEA